MKESNIVIKHKISSENFRKFKKYTIRQLYFGTFVEIKYKIRTSFITLVPKKATTWSLEKTSENRQNFIKNNVF